MTTTPQRDPFAPVDGAVTVILNLLVILLILALGVLVVQELRHGSTDVSVATLGDREACATTRTGTLPIRSSGIDGVKGLRADASEVYRTVELCLRHPTLGQKTASALRPVGDLVFVLVSLWLVRGLIRTGRRRGLFTTEVATRTRRLGLFLLVMSAGFPFVAAAGEGVVVAAAVRGQSWIDQLVHPGIHVSIVIVALGVLTFARILERAVPLQEEVDATV